MYQNLENVLKPIGHKEGRTLKLTAVMVLALGILVVIFVSRGVTWESDKRSIILVGALAVFFIIAIPLGRLRTRRNLRKNFDRFTEAQLLRRSPGIYCGYSKDIVQMYRKNFAGMVAHVEEKLPPGPWHVSESAGDSCDR